MRTGIRFAFADMPAKVSFPTPSSGRSGRRARPAIRRAVITAGLGLFFLPATAFGHVTLSPDSASAGSWTTFAVKVPNESDSAATVKLALKMPPGVTYASYEPVPGWDVKVIKTKLAKPIQSEEGPVNEVVSEIEWTASGGGVKPGQFVPFGLTIPVPGKTGETLTFKAVQTYSDGKISRWIGASGSDQPAPTVKVTAAEAGHGGSVAGESSDSAHDATVAWVGVGLGAVALLLGIAAFVRSGRARS